MTRIRLNEGVFKIRGQDTAMSGTEFDLIEDRVQARGYLLVDGASCSPEIRGMPDRTIRIRCESQTPYTVVSGNRLDETDEEIVERLRSRFQILNDMTQAVKQGTVRAMIVTGPPGVGKSFGVEEVLSKEDLFNRISDRAPKYEVVKGAMSAIGLYSKLYQYSAPGNVVVFDDCDSVLLDDLSLNILKAALDTSKKRTIHWNTDSRLLRSEGIPSSFEFKAGAIFITNIQFENVKSKKLQDHLSALESRCHYIDLQMTSEREKVLRIRQIVEDGMLDSYGFDSQVKHEILDFISDNKHQMRELSLRTVLKIADLRKSFDTKWKEMATVTVMRGAS